MEKLNFKTLYFEITHFCNQKCKHCYLDGGIHNKLYELDTNQIKDIIERFKEQGGRFVTITGGEPFTRTDVFEILDYIDDLGMNFLVATNCLLLNEEKIKKLSQYKNLKCIHTSILGSNKEEHNYIANNNSFDHVLKCIELFDKYRIKSYVQVTLAKNYIDKTMEIADKLSKYNCSIKITPVADIGIKTDKALMEELILKEERYPDFLKYYEAIKQKYGEKIESHNLMSYDEISEEIDYYKDKPLYSLTGMGLILRPNGSKSFSTDLNNPITFGSALDVIEVNIDEELMKYIDSLRKIDLKILELSKSKSAINFYYYQDMMMASMSNNIR